MMAGLAIQQSARIMRTWIIGSGADCDVVVAQPRVSRRHCRFTELADGYLVEDLGSSNGTYVNGERITEETRVLAGDRITLGALVPMPWPPTSGVPGATVLRIGRVADNDIVLDDPRVSGYHARLIVSDSRTLIEDTGSANGTFVSTRSETQGDTRRSPWREADTVYFGSLAVPATRLLPARTMPEDRGSRSLRRSSEPRVPRRTPGAPQPSIGHAPRPSPAGRSLLLAQAPVHRRPLILVVLAGRWLRPATAASWPAVAESIASTTFALAIGGGLAGRIARRLGVPGRAVAAEIESGSSRPGSSPRRVSGSRPSAIQSPWPSAPVLLGDRPLWGAT